VEVWRNLGTVLAGAARDHLIRLLLRLERFDEATQMAIDAVKTARMDLGPRNLLVSNLLWTLGEIYTRREQWNRAEGALRYCLEIRKQVPPTHGARLSTVLALGSVLTMREKFEEAESLLLGARDVLKGLPRAKEKLRLSEQHLAALYDAWGSPKKAAACRARLTELDRAAAADK